MLESTATLPIHRQIWRLRLRRLRFFRRWPDRCCWSSTIFCLLYPGPPLLGGHVMITLSNGWRECFGNNTAKARSGAHPWYSRGMNRPILQGPHRNACEQTAPRAALLRGLPAPSRLSGPPCRGGRDPSQRRRRRLGEGRRSLALPGRSFSVGVGDPTPAIRPPQGPRRGCAASGTGARDTTAPHRRESATLPG